MSESEDNLSVRQSSSIGLKPIINVNKDVTDDCNVDKIESAEEYSYGINIKFQNLIYQARREISLDRCKFHECFCFFQSILYAVRPIIILRNYCCYEL